ncbi:MAG: T9SS type A sorting domain-containing protein [Ignavibacteria bacterium]|jgi:hypothetical protein
MKLLLLILFTASTYVCFSQTINAPIIPSAGVEFSVRYMNSIVSNVPINGGWDFSFETTTAARPFKVLPASASTSASNFPLATHVTRNGVLDEAFVAYDGINYKFCGTPEIPGIMPEMVYPRPLVMCVFPMNSGYVHRADEGITFTNQGNTIRRVDSIVVQHMSSGPLTLPDGTTFPTAMLFKVLRYYIDSNPLDPPGTPFPTFLETSFDMYHWWVDGYPVPLVETSVYNTPGQAPTNSSTFRKPLSMMNIEENQALNVSIYQNSANDVIVVTAPIRSSITVVNINGQVIKTQLTEGFETTLNVSDLTMGVYVVKVQTAEGIATQKIVKE